MNLFLKRVIGLGVLLFSAFVFIAQANQPVIESQMIKGNDNKNIVERAVEVSDPTLSSLAIYGNLSAPDEIDVYTFKAANTEKIPIEALVPARVSNKDFRPSVVVIGRDVGETQNTNLPFSLPEGQKALVITAPQGEREVFFEPYSLEKLYRGRSEQLEVKAGQTYYVAVYEPNSRTGDYSVGLGAKASFEKASFPTLIGNVFKIKLGLATGKTTSYTDFFGILLFIMGLALGLGATAMAVLLGFAAGNYEFRETTLLKMLTLCNRLNWLGIIAATVGAIFTYQISSFSGVALFQIICAVVLVLLSLYVSFRLTKDIRPTDMGGAKKSKSWKVVFTQTASFISWLIGLGLFVWYLLILR